MIFFKMLIKIWEARLLNAHTISPNSLHDLTLISPVSNLLLTQCIFQKYPGTYNSLNTLCVFMFWHLCNIQLGWSPRKFLCFTCDLTHRPFPLILAWVMVLFWSESPLQIPCFPFPFTVPDYELPEVRGGMLIFKAYLNT